jgi:hypothetical protein
VRNDISLRTAEFFSYLALDSLVSEFRYEASDYRETPNKVSGRTTLDARIEATCMPPLNVIEWICWAFQYSSTIPAFQLCSNP